MITQIKRMFMQYLYIYGTSKKYQIIDKKIKSKLNAENLKAKIFDHKHYDYKPI